MRNPVLFVPLLGALLWAPAPVLAQTLGDEPRTPGWVVTPAMRVGGTWDDNVLLLFREETTPRDYGSPISPGISLDFTGRQTRFSGGYDGSFVLYRTLDELNSTEQTVRALIEHRPTRRLLLFAHEAFISAPTTDVLEVAGVPFNRVGSRSNSLGGGFEATLTRQASLRAEYTVQSVDFDFDEQSGIRLRGGHAHQVRVGYGHIVSARLSLDAEYTLQHAFVAGRPDLPEFPEDRFSVHGVGAGATYKLNPTTTLTGGLGVARLLASETQDARTGPTLRAGIAHRRQRVELSAAYQRSFIPSFGFGGTFQNEDLSARAHVPFSRNRAYVESIVGWLNNDAVDPALPSLRSLRLVSTVGYRATRWLSVEAFYGHTRQNTVRPVSGTLSRNQIGFQVVTAKPFNLR